MVYMATGENRKASRSRMRRGFSLVETMIAMLVLGFGLLTIASAQVYAVKSGQTGRHRTRAVQIAQTQMEQLQSSRWTAIAPTGWTAPIDVTTTVEAPTTQVEQNYDMRWRITNVIPDQTRALDVQVSWTDAHGVVKAFTLSSTRFNFEGL